MNAAATLRFSVLLIDNGDGVEQGAGAALEQQGLSVVNAGDTQQALDCLDAWDFDVVMLDLVQPSDNGISICQAIRRDNDIPILVLDPRDAEDERIRGLNNGVDQYIRKPVSPRELVAHVRAHARRRRGLLRRQTQEFNVGPLRLDVRTQTATLHGRALSLTGYEFALLRALAAEPGRVMTRDQLLAHAKGSASDAFDRSIDVRISRLRQKLGDKSRTPKLLRTIRGVGYTLAATESSTVGVTSHPDADEN